MSKSTPLFGVQATTAAAMSPSGIRIIRNAKFSELCEYVVVAFAVEHYDREICEWNAFVFSDRSNHLFNGHVRSYFAHAMVACGYFEVVSIVGENLEASGWGTCKGGNSVFSAFASRCCPVNGIDNKFDFGSSASSDFLTVGETGGIVFRTFAADDFSINVCLM